MKNYSYKCVSVPRTITLGKKGINDEAIKKYEEIINEHAKDGWQLDKVDEISSFRKAGCLMALLGTNGIKTTLKILIYKKEVM